MSSAARRCAVVVAGLLALLLGGCSGEPSRTVDATAVAGPKIDTLRAWVEPTDGLHPHRASPHLTAALFTPLVQTTSDAHLPTWGDGADGALLQDIRSGDLQRWDLTIKAGWRWHDGTEVVADDVVRGWQAAVDAELPLASTVLDVRSTGPTTLSVALTAPFGQFPHLLAHPTFLPLPPLAQTSPSRFAASPIGNGPYRLAGRIGGDLRLDLVADHPRADPASVPRLLIGTDDLPGTEVELVAGADGQLLPPGAPVTAGRSQVVRLPGRQLAYLGLPLTDARYASADVRTALSLAIDVESLAEDVLGGAVLPADRLIGPGSARIEGVRCDACRHDPDEASSLWPEDFDEPLTIWFSAGAGHEPVIEAIAADWTRTLGVQNLQLATLPADDLLARLGQNSVSGPFRLSWQADASTPVRTLDPLFGPRGGANDARYRSDQVADLLRNAALDRDLGAGLERYGAVEAAVLADLPVIPLWFSTLPVAARPDISGIGVDGEGRLDWTGLRRTR